MSKSGWFLVGIFVALVVCMAVGFTVDAEYKKGKAAFEGRIKELETQVDTHIKAAGSWRKEAELQEKRADEFRVQAETSWAKYLVILKQRDGLLTQVAAFPPTDVVIRTAEFLGLMPEMDIYLNSFGIQFSLSAGRTNLGALTEFYLVERPAHANLKIAYGQKSLEAEELRGSLDSVQNENDELILAFDYSQQALADYKNQLDKSEARNKWKFGFNLKTLEHVGIPVVSFILGVVVGK